MRTGISFAVSPTVRRRLRGVIRTRNAPQKHVWRAQIVLLSADGAGTNTIMRQTGKSKTCVWRWQQRFMDEGFDGLLRDKTRRSRIAPLGAEVPEGIVALTLGDTPGEATYWTAAMMAKQSGDQRQFGTNPPLAAGRRDRKPRRRSRVDATSRRRAKTDKIDRKS